MGSSDGNNDAKKISKQERKKCNWYAGARCGFLVCFFIAPCAQDVNKNIKNAYSCLWF